jgi:hypothetical protein
LALEARNRPAMSRLTSTVSPFPRLVSLAESLVNAKINPGRL